MFRLQKTDECLPRQDGTLSSFTVSASTALRFPSCSCTSASGTSPGPAVQATSCSPAFSFTTRWSWSWSPRRASHCTPFRTFRYSSLVLCIATQKPFGGQTPTCTSFSTFLSTCSRCPSSFRCDSLGGKRCCCLSFLRLDPCKWFFCFTSPPPTPAIASNGVTLQRLRPLHNPPLPPPNHG